MHHWPWNWMEHEKWHISTCDSDTYFILCIKKNFPCMWCVHCLLGVLVRLNGSQHGKWLHCATSRAPLLPSADHVGLLHLHPSLRRQHRPSPPLPCLAAEKSNTTRGSTSGLIGIDRNTTLWPLFWFLSQTGWPESQAYLQSLKKKGKRAVEAKNEGRYTIIPKGKIRHPLSYS